MMEINYTNQNQLTLTGEEEKIIRLKREYVIVKNNTGNTVYISKDKDIAARIYTEGVKAIEPGQMDYIAAARGVSNHFYALGTGNVEIELESNESICKLKVLEGNIRMQTACFSNPNLLINPNFKINQRGSTKYNNIGYTVDRWKLQSSGGTLEVTNDAITLNNMGNTSSLTLYQRLEYSYNDFAGKYMTISVQDAKGAIYSASDMLNANEPNEMTKLFSINMENGEVALYYSVYYKQFHIACQCNANSAISIANIKLEIGNVATQITPPDPTTELLKCQRYYQIRSSGEIAYMDLRPNMRANPVVAIRSDGNYEYAAELD